MINKGMRYNESCFAVCQGTKALYRKMNLKSKFSFDEDGVRKIYKNLKAYGVLRA